MTSRDRLTAVHMIAEVLHAERCVPGARPPAAWPEEHLRADRQCANRVYDRLLTLQLVAQPGRMAVDFLAVP